MRGLVVAFLLFAFVSLSLSATARAHDARVGFGLSFSAYGTNLQADLDLTDRIGFQGAMGQSVLTGDVALQAGGRFYLRRNKLFSPYVGGIYGARYGEGTTFRVGLEAPTSDGTRTGRFAGPTAGVIMRAKHGLGAWVQLEYLADLQAFDWRVWEPSVGGGIQWWF